MMIFDNRLLSRVRQIDCAVNLLGALLLLGIVAGASTPPIYDEPHRLETTRLLIEDGFTVKFLREMPHAPGPLTPVIQSALVPWTHLLPPGIRLTNIGFLVIALAAVYSILRLMKAEYPLATTLGAIAIPANWVTGGLALSEMPAIAFLAICLCAVKLICISQQEWKKYAASLIAGLFLALAILGRQPFLLVVPALLCLAVRGRRDDLVSTILIVLIAVVIPFPVFAIWGGLTPPLAASAGEGISFANGIMAFGYAGIFMLIIAPAWLVRPSLAVAATVGAACVAVNIAIGLVKIAPLASVARRILPATFFPLYEGSCGAIWLTLAVWFVGSLMVFCWARRTDRYEVFLGLATILVLATTFKITTNFSSRYVSMCFPMLVLMSRDQRVGPTLAFRSLCGNLLGAASLLSYLKTT